MIVDMSREIIHPAGHINKLPVGQALTHFFNGAVNITQVWFYFFDGFAIQRDHQVQYAMGGRMLWSYIDDQITFLPIGSELRRSLLFEFRLHNWILL